MNKMLMFLMFRREIKHSTLNKLDRINHKINRHRKQIMIKDGWLLRKNLFKMKKKIKGIK